MMEQIPRSEYPRPQFERKKWMNKVYFVINNSININYWLSTYILYDV